MAEHTEVLALEAHVSKVAPWHDFLAGNFAGMAQVLVGQPLDTIKVRLQIASGTGRFTGAWDCFIQTIRHEGFFALYKGMASPLVGIGAVNALLFAANSRFKSALQSRNSDPSAPLAIQQIALAGAGAGAVNSVLSSPVELLKIRMQTQYGKAGMSNVDQKQKLYKGPVELVRTLIAQDGIRHGLFRGYWATVAREIPAYAGFYSGFEVVKRTITTPGEEPSVPQLMMSGAAGGVSYWLCCYPLDVIKSVSQNQVVAPRGGIGYIGRTAANIYRKQGMRGFFAGFAPSIIRSIPAAGATFTTYEMSMRIFQKL